MWLNEILILITKEALIIVIELFDKITFLVLSRKFLVMSRKG